jgi:hypothetical protein
MAAATENPPHFRATYNEIHKLIRDSAVKIQTEFAPDMFIAIGASRSVVLLHIWEVIVTDAR